jgi:hypothetical protein
MTDQIGYLMEELKILSSKSIYLRQRLDGISAFYLTGVGALATAAIGLLSLQQIEDEYKSPGIGLVYLGISIISAYVFTRVLHFRFRMTETEIQMNTIRNMILKNGISTAAYLASENPKNDLYITRRSGSMIFGLGIFSSIGLVLAIHSFFGKSLLSLEWVVIVISLIVSITVFGLTQTREAHKIEKILLLNKGKETAKKLRKPKTAG